MTYEFEWDSAKAEANVRKHGAPFEEGANPDRDSLQPEYDFSKATRGETAARYGEGTNVVVLDPELRELFPDSESVKDAEDR